MLHLHDAFASQFSIVRVVERVIASITLVRYDRHAVAHTFKQAIGVVDGVSVNEALPGWDTVVRSKRIELSVDPSAHVIRERVTVVR